MPLPAPADPSLLTALGATAQKTAKSMESMLRTYKRDRARVRLLCLFADRVYKKDDGVDQVRKQATVAWDDRPEIELILRRVQLIERIQERIAHFDQSLGSTLDPLQIVEAMSAVASQERMMQVHMERIEAIFAALAKEHVSRESVIAGVAMKMAQLAQQLQLHRDGKEDLSDAQVLKRVASKYGLSEEQARAMLDAQSVQAEHGPG